MAKVRVQDSLLFYGPLLQMKVTGLQILNWGRRAVAQTQLL